MNRALRNGQRHAETDRVEVGSRGAGPLNRHQSSLNKMHKNCPKSSSGLGLLSFLKEG